MYVVWACKAVNLCIVIHILYINLYVLCVCDYTYINVYVYTYIYMYVVWLFNSDYLASSYMYMYI